MKSLKQEMQFCFQISATPWKYFKYKCQVHSPPTAPKHDTFYIDFYLLLQLLYSSGFLSFLIWLTK